MAIEQGQLSATATAIVTVSAGQNPKIVTNDWWYNTDASSAYGIDVHIVKSGGAYGTTNQIADIVGTSIAANSTVELGMKDIRLDVGDSIVAKSDLANTITYTIATKEM